MNRTCRALWLLPLALALAGAAPLPHVEDLIRQGNAAFLREEYEAALHFYQQAEATTTDPGLVAFNEGAALYRLASALQEQRKRDAALATYREAELRYRRSLEGADGPRRARALYDLGNCLLQQGQDRDPKLLAEAVRCYEECRDSTDAEPSLLADAGHNLELARLLWFKARKEAPEAPPRNDEGASSDSRKDPKEDKPQPGTSSSEGADPKRQDKNAGKQGSEGQDKPSASKQPTPGRGTLPTLPDADELVPLSPEDTAAYLERVAARVAREQRESWRSQPALARNVKDW